MQGWTWRAVIVVAVVIVLVYTATRPDPEIAGLYQSSPSQLVEMLGSSRDVVRRGAAAGLLSRGSDSVPALVEAAPTATDDQFEQIFLVLEDLYFSADESTADAAEDAIERLRSSEIREIRRAADQVLQSNLSRLLLRACSKIESYGGKFVASPLAVMREPDLQFPYDIVVIDADWSGGEEGLKYFQRFRRPAGFQSSMLTVHIANAAPVTEAAIRKLKETSAVRRQSEACLGLLIRDRSDSDGVNIRRLAPQSPAARADLQENDVLMAMGEHPIHSTYDYFMQMQRHQPGEVVLMKIRREKQELDVSVTLGSDFGTGQCRCDGEPEDAEPIVPNESDGPPGRGRFLLTTDHVSPPTPGPARIPQRGFGDIMPGGLRP